VVAVETRYGVALALPAHWEKRFPVVTKSFKSTQGVGMRRTTMAAMAVAAAVLMAGTRPVDAQTIAGGLTALPTITFSPDRLQNGGFESLSGGSPAGWSTGSGWGSDQLEKHSGTFSYRRTSGAPSASQTLQLRKGVYNLSGWVKTSGVGGTNAGVRLQVDLRPGISNWFSTAVINGTRDWTLYEIKNVIIPRDATVAVKLENYGGATGTAWFDDVKLVEQLPQGVDVYMLYPNFRGMLFDDGPQSVRLDVTVTPPNGDFARYRVAAALKDQATGQVVDSETYPAAAHLVADLNGAAMQGGRAYLATVSLVDGNSGSTVYTYPAYRVSRVPAAARASMNVAFDAQNRVLLKGRPRFVLGLYDSGGGFATEDAYWEQRLWSPTGDRRLEGVKFNMYLNYWLGEAPAPAMKSLMANLQKHGVMYLQTGNCFSQWAAGNQFAIHGSDAYVQDIGAHPGSAGYYTADECKSTLAPGIFEQYVRLRQLDPDSMTFAALFGHDDIKLWHVRPGAGRRVQPQPGRRMDGDDPRRRQERKAVHDRAAVLQVHVGGPVADAAGDAEPRLDGHRGGRARAVVVVRGQWRRGAGHRLRRLVRREGRPHERPQGRRQRDRGPGAGAARR
jgi:hypothetical protein